jgi:hypothetical protein
LEGVNEFYEANTEQETLHEAGTGEAQNLAGHHGGHRDD